MGLDQVASKTAAHIDYDRYRLRNFVEELAESELERRSGTTKLSAIAGALEANPKAVLFEAAGSGGYAAGRQCAREPHALRQGLRRHAAKAAAGNPAPAAQQAGDRRGQPRGSAGAGRS